jgi:hypothetical protein
LRTGKTLHFIAARQAQQDPLVLGFDALHQHRQAERASERHDRLDNYATIG